MYTQPLGPHFRGPRPDDCSFLTLKQIGVQTILNLERGYFDFITGRVNEEAEMALRIQMIPVSVEFGDLMIPTKNQLEACLWVLQEAKIFGTVFVHCLHGRDRTGMVAAYYRVKVQGWEFERAYQEMIVSGFNKALYGPLGWVSALKKYCGG